MAAFQGASYFRAVDGDKQYGMSQRGLAIDCGLTRPEEFPDFVAYYLERPARNASQVTVYALLDSPSVAGAYRFVIDVADTIVMDVDAALYPRRPIERLGIAPGTSMFLCGTNDRRVADDWRPAIHDSDGLQIYNGAGEWLWRPLVNPAAVRVNCVHRRIAARLRPDAARPRTSTITRTTACSTSRRPSVWVEPKGDWGKGAVMLVELPTADETVDNIVAFWTSGRAAARRGGAVVRLPSILVPRAIRGRAPWRRCMQRVTASAASSASSAATSPGASWSISPAVISRCSARMRRVERDRQRLARADRDHLGAAAAPDPAAGARCSI